MNIKELAEMDPDDANKKMEAMSPKQLLVLMLTLIDQRLEVLESGASLRWWAIIILGIATSVGFLK